jgi:hypothetical protein
MHAKRIADKKTDQKNRISRNKSRKISKKKPNKRFRREWAEGKRRGDSKSCGPKVRRFEEAGEGEQLDRG